MLSEILVSEISMAKHHRPAYMLHMNVVYKWVSTNMVTARKLSIPGRFQAEQGRTNMYFLNSWENC